MVLSLLLVLLAAEDVSAPPLVSAPEGPPPMPRAEAAGDVGQGAAVPQVSTASPLVALDDDAPKWNAGAWATATVPTSLDGAPFLYGFRGELDVWRIGASVTLDRGGTTPFTFSSVDAWTGALGYSLFLNEYLRVRAMGAVSARVDAGTAVFAPGVGLTARAGWSFIAVEGSALFTPFGAFRQLDARAEAVLVGGIFELHVGARALYLDDTEAGSLGTLFSAAPLAGPSVAIGVRL